MAGIDTRIMVTDPNGKGRYLAIRSFSDRLTITDESTGQVMTIALTMSVAGDNNGDQIAATVPLDTVWGVSASNLQDATEQLSGEIGAISVTPYIVRTPQPMMEEATALSLLTTGILHSTTATGQLKIAEPADFPTLNQDTTGNAATATLAASATLAAAATKLQTARTIAGKSFDGTANITIAAADVGAIASRTAVTVNANATDLATVIALTNQLRAILISHNMAV